MSSNKAQSMGSPQLEEELGQGWRGWVAAPSPGEPVGVIWGQNERTTQRDSSRRVSFPETDKGMNVKTAAKCSDGVSQPSSGFETYI